MSAEVDKFSSQTENIDTNEVVNFDDFRQAIKVFGKDLYIVNHPELPIKSPLDEPNPDGVYSLTQIPEEMTEKEFIEQLKEATDIVFTCMDKDCAHSTWDKISNNGERKVAMFTWGGGVVQHNIEGREEAVEAMGKIAHYLANLKKNGRLPNLETIHADDHDSVCGAVKAFLGGVALHEHLTKLLGREITPNSPEEDMYMEWFTRHGAQVFVNAFAGTTVTIKADLHYTDRNNPEESKLTEIPLGAGLPEMDVAAFIEQMKLLSK